MRRLLSLVLLMVFGLLAVAPALGLSQAGDASLPACCRRHGVHHCDMGSGKQTGAAAFRSICPSFPQPAATSSATTLYADVPATHRILFIRASAAFTPRTASFALTRRDLSHPKRGPPTIL